MDQGSVGTSAPVSPGGTAAGWGLNAAIASDMQGLILSPYEHAPEAEALFLELTDECGSGWLRALLKAGFITSGTSKECPCSAIALNWGALRRMRLPSLAWSSFPAQFQEGMTDVDRQRRLGDDRSTHKLEWSGNIAWEQYQTLAPATPPNPAPQKTPVTVHALLLLYGANRGQVERMVTSATAAMAGHGVTTVKTLSLSLHSGAGLRDLPREHFGFADGVSQPLPHLNENLRDKLHGIPVGEVLMGYPNAHNEVAPMPSVTGCDHQASLGLNGSYLVVRQLHQDVAGFRTNMAEIAAATSDPAIDADWVAERVVGRTRDGDVLIPGGTLPAVAGEPDNRFAFFAKDRDGLGCPIGSHVRRANPRDGRAPQASSCDGVLKAANNHRVLRRGRKYGTPLPDGVLEDDSQQRGLLFMCLQGDIARQFEFVQQTWMMNPVFGTLMEETDPLVGLKGAFTIPADPLRRIVEVKTFVTLLGGEYFFLPSMRALAYLGGLE